MIRQFQDEWTLLFRLECNKQIIDYDSNVTGQLASICSCMQRTDDFEKLCMETVLQNIEHDNEYELNQGNKPLSSDSTHTIPITGGGIVFRQTKWRQVINIMLQVLVLLSMI